MHRAQINVAMDSSLYQLSSWRLWSACKILEAAAPLSVLLASACATITLKKSWNSKCATYDETEWWDRFEDFWWGATSLEMYTSDDCFNIFGRNHSIIRPTEMEHRHFSPREFLLYLFCVLPSLLKQKATVLKSDLCHFLEKINFLLHI